MIITCITLALTYSMPSAEAVWPDLPDPIGLGPRLTLISWLRDHGQSPAAGASDADILTLYKESTRNTESEYLAAEINHLRYTLKRDHGIAVPDGLGADELRQRLRAENTTAQNATIAENLRLAAIDAQRSVTYAPFTDTTESNPPSQNSDVPGNPPRRDRTCTHIAQTERYTIYRYDDGSATAVHSDGTDRSRLDLPVPPSSSAGWSTVANSIGSGAYSKNGQIMLRNTTHDDAVVSLNGCGLGMYFDIVPAHGLRIIPGFSKDVDLRFIRPECVLSKPVFQKDVAGIKVLLPP